MTTKLFFAFPRILFLVRNELGMMISGQRRGDEDVRYFREDYIARAFDAGGDSAMSPDGGRPGSESWFQIRERFLRSFEDDHKI